MSTTTEFGLPAFVAAVEARDADAQIALFSDDAEISSADHRHPPSTPEVFRGRQEIATFLRDICERDMTHRVTEALATDDRLAYELDCAYPDGTHVKCQAIARLKDGQIISESMVQTWDH